MVADWFIFVRLFLFSFLNYYVNIFFLFCSALGILLFVLDAPPLGDRDTTVDTF